MGAANVLRWDAEQGHWEGGNLDGDGFVAGLKERGHTLAGKRVLLLGAGGAGKAIAYAVGREQPAMLVLSNRSMARAEEAVMIGDRFNDVEGAHAMSVPCIGIYSGAAAPGEHEAAGADAVVHSVAELAKLFAI